MFSPWTPRTCWTWLTASVLTTPWWTRWSPAQPTWPPDPASPPRARPPPPAQPPPVWRNIGRSGEWGSAPADCGLAGPFNSIFHNFPSNQILLRVAGEENFKLTFHRINIIVRFYSEENIYFSLPTKHPVRHFSRHNYINNQEDETVSIQIYKYI